MVDKKKGIPKSKGLPMIGKPKKTEIQEAIQQLVQYLDPIISALGNQVEAMDRRLSVVEEMVSDTIVEILAQRVEKKLRLDKKNPVFESVKIVGKPLPERAKKTDGGMPVLKG